MNYLFKILLSSVILVGVSELGKRSSFWGAILGSLPIISIVAFIWIYLENQETKTIASLSSSIFWLVIPSLLLFAVLPILLKNQINFWLALLLSCSFTLLGYWLMIKLLKFWNIVL